MSIIEAVIIAIVEGFTEFLPVSSTGHMVVTSSLFGIQHEEFTKLFEVAIQLGAILAVVVLYWRKFIDFSKWQFYAKLIVAVIPALIFGKLFNEIIDEKLGDPVFIAWMFIMGGVVLLFIDKLSRFNVFEFCLQGIFYYRPEHVAEFLIAQPYHSANRSVVLILA